MVTKRRLPIRAAGGNNKQHRATANLHKMNELMEINHLKKPSEETKGTTITNQASKNKSKFLEIIGSFRSKGGHEGLQDFSKAKYY